MTACHQTPLASTDYYRVTCMSQWRVNEPPWALIPPLFKTRESLTRPVNRHTSLVPATLPHAHTHNHTQRHKQSRVKYLTVQVSLHCFCHHLLYCISSSVSLPVLSAHLLSLMSFLPSFSSVHLFSYFSSAFIRP